MPGTERQVLPDLTHMWNGFLNDLKCNKLNIGTVVAKGRVWVRGQRQQTAGGTGPEIEWAT